MKKFFAILFVLLLTVSAVFAGETEILPTEKPVKTSIIYVPHGEPIHNPNPEFLEQYSSGRTSAVSDKFQVVYRTAGTKDDDGNTYVEVPAAAKAALDYALAIWASYLNTTVPIVVRVGMASLPSGTIGWNWSEPDQQNFTNAPQPNVWYAPSLANALAGKRVGTSTVDTNVDMSVNFAWYYGIDGQCPKNEMDFVTIMLHEITHGLNFSGRIRYTSGQGDKSRIGVYDLFTVDGSGQYLKDYTSASALGSALTSGQLFFAGPKAKAANNGNSIKIYAPSTWRGGSSYSHVDDIYRKDGKGNDLMLYSAARGDVNHIPGAFVMGILEDMGWNRGSVIVTPVTSVTIPSTAAVDVNKTITLTATVLPNTADQRVTWSTTPGNGSVTVVDGVVKGLTVGTASVTATTVGKDGNNVTKTSNTCTVTVSSGGGTAPTITVVLPKTASVAVGSTTTLTATVNVSPSTVDQSLKWERAIDTVGLVEGTASGKVATIKGLREGLTYIYATSMTDPTAFDICAVTVTAAPTPTPTPSGGGGGGCNAAPGLMFAILLAVPAAALILRKRK